MKKQHGLMAATILTLTGLSVPSPAQEMLPEVIVTKPGRLPPAVPLPPDLQPVPPGFSAQKICNWYSMQGWAWSAPPYPFNWFWYRQDIAWYFSPTVGTNSILLDDRLIDYDYIAAQKSQATAAAQTSQSTGDGVGGGAENGPGPWPPPYYATNLWLEIALDNSVPNTANLVLHNTTTNYYQLLTRTTPTEGKWSYGEFVLGFDFTNDVWFSPVSASSPPMQFYRAVSGEAVVSIRADDYRSGYANPVIEPCSATESNTPGRFVVSISPPLDHDIAVVYTLSGSAQNGVDYTFLPGTVVISNNTAEAYIYVNALYDSILEFEERVRLTLVLTNGYLVNPGHYSDAIGIRDCASNLFQVVATNIAGADLDWYAPSNWLMVSASAPWADSNYFAVISLITFTNGGIVTTNGVSTHWSCVGGDVDEIKMATVRTTDHGWKLGETYFTPFQAGQFGTIGWISTNGTQWSTNWFMIPGETNYLKGSLYFDATGIWGGDLIVVTGQDGGEPGQNVWRIDSHTNVTLITHVAEATHLEGICALPQDAARYGPWAGKLLVGGEPDHVLWIISTNGTYTAYPTDTDPADIDLIPTNQDLYINIPTGLADATGAILKLPKEYLAGYVGDLLVTKAGESGYPLFPGLFIFHWNNTTGSFEVRSIPLPTQDQPDRTNGFLEHSTFAPISLPPIPL